MNIKHIFQRVAIALYIFLSVFYVIWRTGFTLNMGHMVASAILLTVDIVTCFSAILFVVSFWRRSGHAIPSQGTKQFTVDVFVPTYNEDCTMLETTLQHCIDMDYPHQTWLLDDGKRPKMKALAERLGVRYITREQNIGAKAGNLNNAMQYTQGELMAIFDADFRPEKEFLTKLINYFHNEKIAIAQVPQSYYNTDSFLHRQLSDNEIYSDQDTFQHLLLPARDNWNAAYWLGTNALLRREAIELIGGFPIDCVTEDVLASMFIHSKGLKSVYVDEPLAWGYATANLLEYYIQRLRWAKGAFQILRSHHPLFLPGLSFMQRLFYLSSVIHFFEGGIKIVYYLFPAFFFLFGVVPIIPYPSIILGMLAYVLITRMIFKSITNRRTNFLLDEVYSVIKSFIYLTAQPAFIFNKKIRFRVTPKEGRKGRKPVSWPGLVGPVVIFGCNLAVIVAAIFNPYMVVSLGVWGWICFGWCLYMGYIAYKACYYCIEPLLNKTK
jgi:cellulose synthase (UDP-forming)